MSDFRLKGNLAAFSITPASVLSLVNEFVYPFYGRDYRLSAGLPLIRVNPNKTISVLLCPVIVYILHQLKRQSPFSSFPLTHMV